MPQPFIILISWCIYELRVPHCRSITHAGTYQLQRDWHEMKTTVSVPYTYQGVKENQDGNGNVTKKKV